LARARSSRVKGRRLLEKGNVGAAVGAFCEAHATGSHEFRLALELTQALLLARAPEAAREWAEQALALDGSHSGALELYGDILARQGDVHEARKQWFKAHDITRPDASVIDELQHGALLEAKSALKRHDFPRAERLYRRAAALNDQSSEAMTGVAQTLLAQDLVEPAGRWVRRSLDLEPNEGQTQLIAGDVEAKLGNSQKAEAHWRRAVELAPHNFAARRRLRQLKSR
jgi:tetratricopeptide (TPR) repeat protein